MGGSRKEAIKAYCLWCTCNQQREVRLCPSKDCPLWVWRLGYEVDLETGNRIVKRQDVADRMKDLLTEDRN